MADLSIYDSAGTLLQGPNFQDNTYAFDISGTYFLSVAFNSNEIQPEPQNYQIEAILASSGTPRPVDVGNLVFEDQLAQGQTLNFFSTQPTDQATLSNGNIAVVSGSFSNGFSNGLVYLQIIDSSGDEIGASIELGGAESSAFNPQVVAHDTGFIVSYFTSNTVDGVAVSKMKLAYFDNMGLLISDDALVEITGGAIS